MTVIVGIKQEGKVYIGGDTQASNGWDKAYRTDSKVFIARGIAYGFTSSYRMGQILKYHSEDVLSPTRTEDTHGYVVKHLVPMWRRILQENGYMKTESGREDSGTFIVGIDGELFAVYDDMQVASTEKDYMSCGCGSSYALGALYNINPFSSPKERISKAIETACEFSSGCGGAINTVEV